jgi:integrase
MAGADTALKKRKPFDEIEWPKSRRKKLDPASADFGIDDDDGPRFKPEEVVALWEAAKDPDLRDTIVIAAFTGARREGIFSLHLNTVFLDAPVPHLLLIERTEAGRRRVPIHPDIKPILHRRVQHPQEDGYLFRGTKNKIGSRSARLTNPMSKLLKAQGFNKGGFGFHSFRRTFVDFLQSTSVSELHAAKIVGHASGALPTGYMPGRCRWKPHGTS